MLYDRFAFPPEVLRRISSRITNEVAGINRVTYDISSKPPAVGIFTSAISFDAYERFHRYHQTVEWL